MPHDDRSNSLTLSDPQHLLIRKDPLEDAVATSDTTETGLGRFRRRLVAVAAESRMLRDRLEAEARDARGGLRIALELRDDARKEEARVLRERRAVEHRRVLSEIERHDLEEQVSSALALAQQLQDLLDKVARSHIDPEHAAPIVEHLEARYAVLRRRVFER